MRTGAQTCTGGENGLFFPRVAFHRFLTSDWLERPKVYHIARHGASPFRMAFRVRVALRNRCAIVAPPPVLWYHIVRGRDIVADR